MRKPSIVIRGKPYYQRASYLVLSLILLGMSTFSWAQAPAISLSPVTASLDRGSTLTVTVVINTGAGTARGGAVVVQFDPAIFEIVGGAAGVTRAAASPFTLTPPPVLSGGRLEIPFLKLDFIAVGASGSLATFQIRALAEHAGSALTLDPAATRFSPDLGGLTLTGAVYRVTPQLASLPKISVQPSSAALRLGDILTVHLAVDTAALGIKGGGILLGYDPALFELVGGGAGISKPAQSPFALSPPPVLGDGMISLAFMEPSFQAVAWTGDVATFNLKAIAECGLTSLTLNPQLTRFSPDLAGTRRTDAGFKINSASPPPVFKLAPTTMTCSIGATINVALAVDTSSDTARGAAAVILFDPTLLEVVGGVEGITRAAGSPFELSPPPVLANGRLELALMEPSFTRVHFKGNAAVFTLRALRRATAAALDFATTLTRFSPDLNDTMRSGASYAVQATDLPSGPQLALSPATGVWAVGDTQQVSVDVDTGGTTARGGAVVVTFDPAAIEIVGGAAGVSNASGSPFKLVPPPALTAGRLEIPFLEPSFQQVSYQGSVARFTIKSLQQSDSVTLDLDATASRFSPDLTGTTRHGAVYNMISTATLGIGVTPPQAHWRLYGPQGLLLENAGTTTVRGVVTGAYTAEWLPLAGWTRPTSSTVILTHDQWTTLTGTYLDLTAPTCQIAINGQARYTSSTAVALALGADDGGGSGAAQMRLREDALTWGTWAPYLTNCLWNLSGGDGARTLSFQVRDAAGNLSAVASGTIVLDTAAPRFAGLSAAPSPARQGAVVTLGFSVTEALQTSPTLTVNGHSAALTSHSALDYTFSYMIAASDPNGAATIALSASDLAGNTGAMSNNSSLVVDKTAPTGNVVINAGATWTSSSLVMLTLFATDGSGVDQMRLSNDGVTWNSWETYTGTRPWALDLNDGIKIVSVQFHDRAGNISATRSASIRLVYPPVFTLHPASLTANPGTTVNLSIAALGSQPLAYQWQKNGVNLTAGARLKSVTSTTLTLSSLQYGDAGNYACVVSNLAVTTTSRVANLKVNPALVILSACGNPVPPVGVSYPTTGTQVTASVPSPVLDALSTTRWASTGWSAVGAAPASGSVPSVTFTIDRPTTITWQWKTQYNLATTVSPAASGTITLADKKTPAANWYDANQAVTLNVLAQPGYWFYCWDDVLRGYGAPTDIKMDAPKSISAQFKIRKNGINDWALYE